MLIGYDYAGFHPTEIRSDDNLVLMKDRFGYCLGVSHHLIKENGEVSFNKIIACHAIGKVTLEDFYSNEALGVQSVPKCGSYRCGEERELATIESGLKMKVING